MPSGTEICFFIFIPYLANKKSPRFTFVQSAQVILWWCLLSPYSVHVHSCMYIHQNVIHMFQIIYDNKKMQRNCEKINHRWFHYDWFVNRVGKMRSRSTRNLYHFWHQESQPATALHTCQSLFLWVVWYAYFPQQSMSCDETIQ